MRLATAEPVDTTDAPRAGWKPKPAWWLPAGVAVASAVVFVLVQPYLIDDAYITLTYAKNLAFHGHWGLIEQGTANTATSPLNVLALAALTFVLRDAVFAAGVLFVASQVLLVLALRRIGGHAGLPSWFAPLAAGLMLVNPLLVSSIGLELTLGAAGVLWLLVFSTERRPVAFGAMVGLLTLIRLDLLVIVVVIFFARRQFWVGIWRSFFAALAVILPWYLFSWLALGSAVPDTLIIKTLQRSWGPWSFTNGPLVYWRHFPAATALAFLPLVAGGIVGLLWIVRRRKGSEVAGRLTPFAVLAVAGAVHYLAYSWLDVPPYHWYYAPSLVGATVFLAAVAAAIGKHQAHALTLVTSLAVLSAVISFVPGVPRDFVPITSNHATTAQYEHIGGQLGALTNGRPVRSAGEVGALAYYCDCDLLDIFSDRGLVNPAITESKRRSGPLDRALTDANFRFLDQTVLPSPADFVLQETTGDLPPDVLASWDISSPWTGQEHLILRGAHG